MGVGLLVVGVNLQKVISHGGMIVCNGLDLSWL